MTVENKTWASFAHRCPALNLPRPVSTPCFGPAGIRDRICLQWQRQSIRPAHRGGIRSSKRYPAKQCAPPAPGCAAVGGTDRGRIVVGGGGDPVRCAAWKEIVWDEAGAIRSPYGVCMVPADPRRARHSVVAVRDRHLTLIVRDKGAAKAAGQRPRPRPTGRQTRWTPAHALSVSDVLAFWRSLQGLEGRALPA